jgi:CTP-dependent riboflavin kinase
MTVESLLFTGRVASGKGEGARFTRARWARDAFIARVGIDPFPGTLNLRVEDPEARAVWARIRGSPGIHLPAPDPGWCDARLFPVTVAGREPGAIVLPAVAAYPDDQVEIIAAVGLRAALRLEDGDSVEVAVSGGDGRSA